MREILFRGKRIDNGEWVYGNLIINKRLIETAYKISSQEGIDSGKSYIFSVDPQTVGQFTGLADKNGKKIFEGDIVVINTSEKRKIKKYRVEFDNGIFGIRLSTNANDNTIIPLRSFDYIEIINPSIDHLCCSQHVVTKRDIDCAPTIIKAEVSE